MKFKIKNRWTGDVKFECELPAEIAGQPYSVQLGFAIRKAYEARANLTGVNLARAYLADADLAGADLAGAYLARADLAGAYLARANLAGAYLADADLAGTDLADADLARANLTGAYLAGADLEGANLADANLARANLTGAYLARANLARANLAGAYLADAKWRNGIIIQRPPLQLYGLAYPVTILDQHMQIGCELHTLAEWDAFDDERIARMDGVTARRFWKAHKAALLSLARSDGRVVQAEEKTA